MNDMNTPAIAEGGNTSMTGILLEPLNTLQKLSHTLFLSLSPAQNKPPPPPPIEAFIDADAALANALQKTRLHQVNQRKIVALTAEVLELESRLRDVWMELEKGKRDLEEVIEEGNERVKAIEKAKEGASIVYFSGARPFSNKFYLAALPYPELLAYAQSLSAFTSAPPNMPDMTAPGQPPPPLFFPPFPNEEKMRRGRLNAEAPLGMLGETHSVGQRKLYISLYKFWCQMTHYL